MAPRNAGARAWRGLLVAVAVAVVLLTVLDGADGAASTVHQTVSHSNQFSDEVVFEAEDSWDRWDREPAPSPPSPSLSWDAETDSSSGGALSSLAREAAQATQYLAQHAPKSRPGVFTATTLPNASTPVETAGYIPSHELDPLNNQAVAPKQVEEKQKASPNEVEDWDAATFRKDASDLTMPAPQATAVPQHGKKVKVQVEVPKADQGNRQAVDHMMKVTQQEMEKSFPGSSYGPSDDADEISNTKPAPSEDPRAPQVAWQQTMPPVTQAATAPVPVPVPAPEAIKPKLPARPPTSPSATTPVTKAAKAVTEENATPTQPREGSSDEPLPKASCDSVAGCEESAQRHVHRAGSALAKAKEAAQAADPAKESYWKHQVAYEKGGAVAATVQARQLSQGSTKQHEEHEVEAALAKAQSHEGDQKAAAQQTHDFAKKLSSEADRKAQAKLGTLRAAARHQHDQCAERRREAATLKATAEAAAAEAATTRTVAKRKQLEEARKKANRAFGLAHECKGKLHRKLDQADTTAANVEASKQAQAKDSACQEGREMSIKLCNLSYKSASHVCEVDPGQDMDPELVRACMRKAEEDRETCHGLANTRQQACEALARQQVYGAAVSGYELKVGARMDADEYSQRSDFDFRRGVARACAVPTKDVVTLKVDTTGGLEVTVAVIGDELALKEKVAALEAALTGGQAVGGLQASAAEMKWVQHLQLPGQKPRKWVSEKAEKAWKHDEAETRKLTGMPSGYQAREVNAKAHTREMRSKQALAVTKTKEAKLKKVDTEMMTKVAARASQRKQQREVEKAEQGRAPASQEGAGGDTGGSQKGLGWGGGGSSQKGPLISGRGDFTVIRLRWWAHTAEWLKLKYPGLYDTLDKAKKAGNDAGDKVWMRFLLNWFYAKMREKAGFRFTWNADGSYNPARHLVLGCRRYLGTGAKGTRGHRWESGPTTSSGECKGAQARDVYSVSIRSVNNLCYPGVSDADARKYVPGGGGKNALINKRAVSCKSEAPVSVRLARFRLVKPPRNKASGLQTGVNGAPEMMLMRAYRSITPSEYQRTIGEFADEENDGLAGVHRVVWSINEVVEYCEAPLKDGSAAPYDETKSWPRKLHETGKMKWLPIRINNHQAGNSDMMLTVLVLQTEDKKLTITCRTPQVAGVVRGRFLTPTDTKCDIKVSHWDYTRQCPPGKVRGLALSTSVRSRFDDATAPVTSKDGDAYDVRLNSGRSKLQFQKVASLRVLESNDEWANRGDVHMRLVVSEPHWTPSTQYQSHRHYQFSFGMRNMDDMSNSELVWDPTLSSNFRQEEPAERLDLDSAVKEPESLTVSSLLGLGMKTTETDGYGGYTASAGMVRWCPMVLSVVLSAAMLLLGR